MKKLSELMDRLKPDLLCGSPEKEISALVYDSRKITEGCLFIAIRGTNFDGHSAIPQAIEKKAKGIVIISAGFKEVGHDGAVVEKEMQALTGVVGVQLLHRFEITVNDMDFGKTAYFQLCIKKLLEVKFRERGRGTVQGHPHPERPPVLMEVNHKIVMLFTKPTNQILHVPRQLIYLIYIRIRTIDGTI